MKNSNLISIILLLFCLFSQSFVYADEIRYARYPALSPDGSTIVFAYMGDIWTVPSSGGEAIRLTIHDANDIRPHYSPDGKMILFTSTRHDNYDIFIIAASGGKAKRLTFDTNGDFGTGWTPEGDSVIFYSNRNGWMDLYKVSIDKGTPILLTGYIYEQERYGRISSDGKHLLYNNGSNRWWRRDMKSSRPANIFIQDRTQNKFTSRRLTDWKTHTYWPVYNEQRGEVYFGGCRGDWAQIWRIPFEGGEAEVMTDFKGDGIQWLNSNPQGTLLVFEQGFYLWTMDPSGGEPKKVSITINTDERTNLVETRTFNRDVQWFSISPDEKKAAAIIQGEIFIIPTEDPEDGRRITFTPSRETKAVWNPDSKTLYYSSDRNGNHDIYSVDVTKGEEKRLTTSKENEVGPLVSPDGKYLVFYRGLDKLIRYNLETSNEIMWVERNFYGLSRGESAEYDWSPDSKWLAFTLAGPTYEQYISVVPLDGKPQVLSKFSGWSYQPRFSDDGKIVYFSNSFESNENTYEIELQHQPAEFYESSFDSLFIEVAKEDEEEDDKKEDESKEDESKKVIIDFDQIEKRRSLAYHLSGSSSTPVLTPDGEKYVFLSSLLGKPEIWSVNTEDEPSLKQLTHSGSRKSLLKASKDSKSLYYLEGGIIKKLGIDGEKTTTLGFSATMDVDIRKLNRQKFIESWQMLNTYFYDSDFHGADWNAVREKYEPIIDHIRTDIEFGNIITEMLGELRASHLAIYTPNPSPFSNTASATVGIILDYNELEKEGRFKIDHVIRESPADLAGIKPGEFIYEIDGQKLSSDDNYFRYYAGKKDKRLVLNISDKPDKRGDDYNLKPISNGQLGNLNYESWIDARRKIVDELSGDRLGYIHIRRMSGGNLLRFKQDLITYAEEKDGLIIDVRNNGGGNIAVHLLGILAKKQYFLRGYRDFPTTSENKYRSKAYEKPLSLLINSYSASNSEIFAEGFRKLGLGKIIGEQTSGAVIGTGSYTLIDGTRIRCPATGAYTTEMEDTDLIPRQPDFLVEQFLDDFINGRDPQLERAVMELLKEI